ncbi:MAG: PTS sugar transporter subunit IIA [Nitrospirae bacterium]|nr:MAG: PTS sugar transporter subunit IIA [Nitrospirota bacterium]
MALIIAEHLGERRIVPRLAGDTKVAVLRELCRVVCQEDPPEVQEQALAAILEREALGSTGIGEGIAIPHAKVAAVPELRLGLGLSRKGVAFDASDGAPVHILFLIAAPAETHSRDHLQVLARLARLVRAPGFREELLALDSPAEIQRLITRMEREMFEDAPA